MHKRQGLFLDALLLRQQLLAVFDEYMAASVPPPLYLFAAATSARYSLADQSVHTTSALVVAHWQPCTHRKLRSAAREKV
jgi:hypothetical protein